jgi:hypothetical protein
VISNFLDHVAAQASIGCARADCPNLAVYLPILELRAALEGPAAQMSVGLGMCPSHKDTLTVDDFVSEEGWQRLTDTFASLGKQPPERVFTTLRWDAIGAGRRN